MCETACPKEPSSSCCREKTHSCVSRGGATSSCWRLCTQADRWPVRVWGRQLDGSSLPGSMWWMGRRNQALLSNPSSLSREPPSFHVLFRVSRGSSFMDNFCASISSRWLPLSQPSMTVPFLDFIPYPFTTVVIALPDQDPRRASQQAATHGQGGCLVPSS